MPQVFPRGSHAFSRRRPRLPDSETRGAARRRLTTAFAAAGIDSAEIDARLLVCEAAAIDYAAFIRDPDVVLGNSELAMLAEFAARRLRHEPVSRILGRREFWGLDLGVSSSVLDPRPETEGLVASVLDAVGGRRTEQLSMLDLGVGSGAILAALLTELPAAHGIGVDRSEPACRQAQRNMAALGLARRAAMVCSEWTSALGARFDVVVSNPPYIRSQDLAGLATDVRDYDPVLALDGGADGLDAFRNITLHLRDVLAPNGVVAFECGAGQSADVGVLLADAGLSGARIYRDLAGHDRVVLLAR